MKRILISLLLIVTIGSSFTIANAELSNSDVQEPVIENEYSKRIIETFESSGISIHYNKDGFITNIDLAKTLLEMLNIKGSEDGQAAIDILRSAAIIPSDMRFLPDTKVTVDDVYELCVNALGYKLQAKRVGYSKIISRLGLNKGINKRDKVDNETFALLMHNLFRAPVNEVVSIGNKYVQYKDGDALHWVYHRIIYIDDVIYACENFAIPGYESAMRDDHIYIGNVNIQTDDNMIGEFVGYRVNAYAKQDQNDDFKLIIYFIDDDNDVIETPISKVIEAKGFENGDPISYRKNPIMSYFANNKNRTIKMSNKTTVLYNGNHIDEIKNTDFIGDSGKIKVVDYNDDGLFDIIYIKKYEVFRIVEINKENMVLNFEGGYRLEIEDASKLVIRDGNAFIDFKDLEKDMIVGIYTTKEISGKAKVEIAVFSNQITGVVSSIYISGQNNTIIVDGNEYEYDNSLEDKIKLNCNYRFVLDTDDVIIYAEMLFDDTYYAYFVMYGNSNKAFEDEILFKVIEIDNKEHIYSLNKKIKYTGLDENGVWVDKKTMKTDEFMSILPVRFSERTLIKIKKKESIITEIIMPVDRSAEFDYKGWTDDEFTLEEKYGKVQNRLLLAEKSASRNYRVEYVNTLVVLDDEAEEEISMFQYKSNKVNNIFIAAYGLREALIYDSNDSLVTSIYVVKHDPNLMNNGIGANFSIPNEANRQKFIVEDVTTTLNEEGELTYKVTGFLNKKATTYTAIDANVTQKYNTQYADRGCYTVGELQENDVIYVDLDENGKMVNFYFISRP